MFKREEREDYDGEYTFTVRLGVFENKDTSFDSDEDYMEQKQKKAKFNPIAQQTN